MTPLLIKEHQAQDLRQALERFYQTTTDYLAFNETSHHPDRWEIVTSEISEIVVRKGACRVLEFGAGRSGFGKHFRSRNVYYVAQDITGANRDHLKKYSDGFYAGDLSGLQGRFDVIFSTFAFEHVTRPLEVLEKCWELLDAGGVLLLFCPRYDLPGYLPPSLDHLSRSRRVFVAFQVMFRRLWTVLSGTPAFLLIADPSVLHRPWSRDRDAVHLASRFDLVVWAKHRAQVRVHGVASHGLKDWVVKNLLQINVSLHKPF